MIFENTSPCRRVSLPIAVLGLSRRLQSKLLNKEYYYVHEVASLPVEELATILDISISTAKKLLAQLELNYDLPPSLSLQNVIDQTRTISTGIPKLDTLLSGGFVLQTITEITGPTGLGKSFLLHLFAQSLPTAELVFLSTQSSPFATMVTHFTQVAQWLDQLIFSPPQFLLLDNLPSLLEFKDKVIQSRFLHQWVQVLRRLTLSGSTVLFTSQVPCGGIAGTQVVLRLQSPYHFASLHRSVLGQSKCEVNYTLEELHALLK